MYLAYEQAFVWRVTEFGTKGSQEKARRGERSVGMGNEADLTFVG